MIRSNKYEIGDEIGRGSFGVVYKAYHKTLQRPVAIKVLSDNLNDTPTFKDRFLLEARLAAQLSHVNLTTIFDLGEDEGRPYIVMELLQGFPLIHVTKGLRALSLEQKISYARQICLGLQFVHDHKIVHRDIKPANIMIQNNGNVKIMDFGIAKVLSEEFRTNLTQGTVGTINYMSPEQIKGGKIDSRSDIFSFGVLLYELVCRQRPFSGISLLEKIASIQNDLPASIDPAKIERIPQIKPIILKCLEKNPDQRYQKISEAGMDLYHLATDLFDDSETKPLLIPPVDDPRLVQAAASATGESTTNTDQTINLANNDAELTAAMPGKASDSGSSSFSDILTTGNGGKYILLSLAIAMIVLVIAFGSRIQFSEASPIETPNTQAVQTEQLSRQSASDSIASADPVAVPEKISNALMDQASPLRQAAMDKRRRANESGATGLPVFRNAETTFQSAEQLWQNADYLAAGKQYEAASGLYNRSVREQLENQKRLAEIGKARSSADSLRLRLASKRFQADSRNTANFAIETLQQAELQTDAGNNFFNENKFDNAAVAFSEGLRLLDRAFAEQADLQKAEQQWETGDYKSGQSTIQNLLNTSTFGNNRAQKLTNKISEALRFRQTKIDSANALVKQNRQRQALAVLDRLPPRDRQSMVIKNLRQSVINSDRLPPQITHDHNNKYDHNKPLDLEINVTDNLTVKQVWIFFKQKAGEQFQQMALTAGPSPLYRVTIDIAQHQGKEIQYYFRAEDSVGMTGELKDKNDRPFSIKRKERHHIPRPP